MSMPHTARSISTLRWQGSDAGTQAIVDARLDLVLNVRNQPAGVPAPPSVPPRTEAEFNAFQRSVRQR
ncbi:hypothetical protein BH10ACT11_BH10ACT11_10450 [soil metagenome]